MKRYSDIVGQKAATARLSKMVQEDRIPHALLFAGKDGGGALPAAFVFAAHLFCRAPVNDGPCGTCASCLKTLTLSHPDLHIVFPIIKSSQAASSDDKISQFRESFLEDPYLTIAQWAGTIDATNKKPIIPVEESSVILRKLSYTSYEGHYKVLIIWQPETMNQESANRLLKILEEPPEKTVFVLVASRPDQLLPTIISRLQLVQFADSSEEELVEALVKQFGVSAERAREAALLADGSYALAVAALRQDDDAESLMARFQAFMRIAYQPDGIKVSQWVDELAAAGRDKQKQFIQYGLQVFRDCLMYNYGNRDLVKMSGSGKQFLEKFAPFINNGNFEALVEAFNADYYHIDRNANPKILFTDLLLQCSLQIRKKLRQ